jgi:hypothetical protein
MTARFRIGPDAPFIASRRIEHDGSRRVAVAGALIGDDVRTSGPDGDAVACWVLRGRIRRFVTEAAARETAS